jgi:hypothetical protein
MRIHFFSRLCLLLMGGFGVVASQVWTGDLLRWLFVGGGVVMILAAMVDGARADTPARALDGLIGILGVWTILEALLFTGTSREWWSFACAAALVALSTIGLIMHETRTERVVHELSVVSGERQHPAAA